MQFSLWLTKNGRDAAQLMREGMAEAFRSWDELMPDESCKIWLHKIISKRFFNNDRQHMHPIVPKSWLNGETDEDVNYFEAMSNLPAICRSAMIQSYLERFSNDENADLAGVQPQEIELMLNRGRQYIQEKLYDYLIGNDSFDIIAGKAKASG